MTPEEYRQHLIWAGSQKMPRTKTGLFTTPTHKLFSGIVPVTTLLAPITEPLPINAPFKTRALSHIQTCFPIVTFLLIISLVCKSIIEYSSDVLIRIDVANIQSSLIDT